MWQLALMSCNEIEGTTGKTHIEIRGMIEISPYKIEGTIEKYPKHSHNQVIFTIFAPINY